MEQFKELIRKRLAENPVRALQQEGRRRAAILISVLEKDRRPHFLLTLRTQHVATHKGQISFPGGMCDADDPSLSLTALRETREELGIPAERIELLGQFHDCISVTNVVVTPFVGVLEADVPLTPNPREVEEVILIPLDFFRETTPRMETRERNGRRMILYFYDYGTQVVWGLTARIIKDFVELLEPKSP
jgi:8-oxo-dGTP pyrophosphatase MutT (NUDIX family)